MATTFNVQGRVLRKSTGLGVSHATVKVYQKGQAAPLAKVETTPEGKFSTDFSWPLDVSIHSNRPDVHFQVTQVLDGAEAVIYNENPATDSRLNIGDVLSVDLETEQGLTLSKPAKARPFTEDFLFTRVGIIGVDEIDAKGYARPGAKPPTSMDSDAPFGSALHVAAWFGKKTDVHRYKVEYSADGKTWHEVSDPLYNRYYAGGGKWVTMAMGPIKEGGEKNLYKLPYVESSGPSPWMFPDLIARWDTTKVADGTYTLRIRGYKRTPLPGKDKPGTVVKLVKSKKLKIDPHDGELKLRVDNAPPTSKLLKMSYSTSTGWDPVKVCEVVSFKTGKLRLELEASDAAGHLRSYRLDAMYGHNKRVLPRPQTPDKAADDYSAHVAPSQQWKGGKITVDYEAGTSMPTCAYQFRLGVSKRTTNGYGRIYRWVEDTMHVTLQRK